MSQYQRLFLIAGPTMRHTPALQRAIALAEATGAALHITVSTDEGGSLERLESVVADHIKRFAFREELIFDWKHAPA